MTDMREGDRILPKSNPKGRRSVSSVFKAEGYLREGPAKSVLLVDDDSDLRGILKGILEMNNYTVSEACDYSEAVKNFAPHIDIALVDYQLPDGNGIEFLRTVRKTDPLLPVIIMTAFGTEAIAVNSFRTGATDYLKKPFDFFSLLGRMAEKLGGESTEEEIVRECAKSDEAFAMDGVAEYLEENHAQELGLDRLAAMAGMGRFTFCRLFKKKFGRGYLSYLHGIRTEHARELLRNSNLSILDIGNSTGFGSLSQFERAFKEAEGLAPREYRK
ncbi:MAG: response regulator transcription factor, partial [Nitrospirae bacterium]|nr:response regulator transcription factor [Nitrospirota bacterium]